jgi:hypothetical protein
MEITTTTTDQPKPARSAVVSVFALIGFIALLIVGIILAIYSAKYIPKAVSRIGSAAVSLSQSFKPHTEAPALEVVAATTTLPIVETTSTTTAVTTNLDSTATSTATTTVVTTTATKPIAKGGTRVVTAIPSSAPVALFGQADLTVSITDIGYLNDSSNESFVSSTSVPPGKNGAVRFTIMNIGTNVAGQFTFSANIPTSPSFTFTSPTQQALRPGDRIEYTLGFDRGDTGTARTITILADSGNAVDESNESNNSESRAIDIRN